MSKFEAFFCCCQNLKKIVESAELLLLGWITGNKHLAYRPIGAFPVQKKVVQEMDLMEDEEKGMLNNFYKSIFLP